MSMQIYIKQTSAISLCKGEYTWTCKIYPLLMGIGLTTS